MWIVADFIHIRWISLWMAWGYRPMAAAPHCPDLPYRQLSATPTTHMWYCATEAIVVTNWARHRLHPTLPEICSSAVAPNEHMSARVRSNSMSSSTGSCSTRRASSPPASGSFGLRELATYESVRCSRTSNVAQCTICGSNPMRVSTARACRAPSRAWSVTPGRLPMSCRIPASKSAVYWSLV